MTRRVRTAAEQVADCLRDELARGRWTDTIPGIHALAAEFGFSRKMIDKALFLLEQDGLLVAQGKGRKRQIAKLNDSTHRAIRVGILDYDSSGLQHSFIPNLIHHLSAQGHTALYAPKTLVDLDMKPARVARMVRDVKADIWILRSAPAEIRDWFLSEGIPVFAAFGDYAQRPIAAYGLDYRETMLAATRRLIGLGHRRIVYLACRGMIKRSPGGIWCSLMEEMESHGIPTGTYNIPNWEDSREGFNKALFTLFKHTPPTALFIEEPVLLIATMQFLANRGLRIPQDVSIICLQPCPEFDYCQQAITHIDWDDRTLVRHISRWVANRALGRDDIRQVIGKTRLIEGETVGEAPSRG